MTQSPDIIALIAQVTFGGVNIAVLLWIVRFLFGERATYLSELKEAWSGRTEDARQFVRIGTEMTAALESQAETADKRFQVTSRIDETTAATARNIQALTEVVDRLSSRIDELERRR